MLRRCKPLVPYTYIQNRVCGPTGSNDINRTVFYIGLMKLKHILIFALLFSFSTHRAFSQSGTRGEAEGITNPGSFLEAGGKLRSMMYMTTSDPNAMELQSIYALAALNLKVKQGSYAQAYMDIRFRYGNEWQENLQEIELREAWVEIFGGPFSLKAGKVIHPWGKASFFNPSNKSCPSDPTFRSPDQDDMNLGSWQLQAKLQLGNHIKLSAFMNPLYRPGELLIGPIEFQGIEFLEPLSPDITLSESSFGSSVDLYTSLIDISLYGFSGYHSWPGMGFDSYIFDESGTMPVGYNLRETPYRIQMAAMDFSLPLGAWILTAEASWMKSLEDWQSAEYLPMPEFSYTAEIERSGSVFSIIAGYYGKYIPNHIALEDESQASVLSFNRLYYYQEEASYHSLFTNLRLNLFYDRIKAELPLVYNLTTKEWIFRPTLGWSVADGVLVQAGFTGMWGPDDSLYDIAGPVLNAAFFGLTYSF